MIVTMLVLALALSNPVAATQTAGHVDVNRAFNYVVVIVMENHGLRDVINVSSAPFMNQLASSYGLAVNYTAIDHPSLPNYLGLISGQDFSSWSSSDCSPRAGCSAGSAPNLVDSLENRGLTWKAYMEDYPSTCGSHCSPGDCFVGDNGAGVYAARHDPFVYFDDIANSTTRCSRIVPANSGTSGSPDDLFLSDLSSPSTASNFMWLTPNSCNDTHGFTYHNGTVLCTDSISIGDNYLSRLITMETRDTSNWETRATIHGMERMLSVIGTNGPKTIRGKDNLQISLTQQILIQTPLGPRRTEESGQGGSVGL